MSFQGINHKVKTIANLFATTLLSTLILNACTPSDNNTRQYKLAKADSTIRIPIGAEEVSTSRNVRFFKDHGREYLAIENSILKEINVYDLKTRSHVKNIAPEKEGPNGVGKMDGFDIINFDSIYVRSTGYGFSVSLIDSSATLKKKIEIEHSFTPYMPIAILWSCYGANIVQSDSGTFVPNTFLDSDDYFYNNMHESSIGYFEDKKTGRCTNFKTKFPDLRKTEPKVLPSVIYNTIFNGNKTIMTFTNGHQIFVLEDTIWVEHIAKSKYFHSELKSNTQSGSINEAQAKYAEKPCYHVLLHDRYRNVYYRIAYPGIEVKAGDNVAEMVEFRTLFSIMVLDEEFNVMDEMLMPQNTYNIYMFFINEDGLWLSTNHVQNPNFEEEALVFELFTLNKGGVE